MSSASTDTPPRPPSGILNVAKPAGMTSMDVVRRVRRACGIRRVGNAGTLDPIAAGVIPVCVGQATRVVEYLLDGAKEYAAGIRFGESTDTYDALGEIVQRRDASHLDEDAVKRALTAFEGEIDQIPPMYSAIKKGGKPLYEFARAGVEIERESRRVTVYRIALADWRAPVATVEITCGRGFYVRSLAHDLGEALGCGAHMESLTRTRVGPFRLQDSSTLEEVELAFANGNWREITRGADAALCAMRPMALDEAQTRIVANGIPLPPGAFPAPSDPTERRRAYAANGRFLAIMRPSANGRWTPDKVFDPELSPDIPNIAPDIPDLAPDIPERAPDIPARPPAIPNRAPDIPARSPAIPALSPRHSRESGNPDDSSQASHPKSSTNSSQRIPSPFMGEG